MLLSDLSIKQPVFATMLMVGLVVLGIFSYKELSTDLFPKVDLPVVSVRTLYPGSFAGNRRDRGHQAHRRGHQSDRGGAPYHLDHHGGIFERRGRVRARHQYLHRRPGCAQQGERAAPGLSDRRGRAGDRAPGPGGSADSLALGHLRAALPQAAHLAGRKGHHPSASKTSKAWDRSRSWAGSDARSRSCSIRTG